MKILGGEATGQNTGLGKNKTKNTNTNTHANANTSTNTDTNRNTGRRDHWTLPTVDWEKYRYNYKYKYKHKYKYKNEHKLNTNTNTERGGQCATRLSVVSGGSIKTITTGQDWSPTELVTKHKTG